MPIYPSEQIAENVAAGVEGVEFLKVKTVMLVKAENKRKLKSPKKVTNRGDVSCVSTPSSIDTPSRRVTRQSVKASPLPANIQSDEKEETKKGQIYTFTTLLFGHCPPSPTITSSRSIFFYKLITDPSYVPHSEEEYSDSVIRHPYETRSTLVAKSNLGKRTKLFILDDAGIPLVRGAKPNRTVNTSSIYFLNTPLEYLQLPLCIVNVTYLLYHVPQPLKVDQGNDAMRRPGGL